MADEVQTSKKQKRDYTFAVGRRRSAVARVRMYDAVKDGLTYNDLPVKKGEIIVNGMPVSDYFSGMISRYEYTSPLRVANVQNQFAFTIKVEGGGKAGQLDAVIHGISQALSEYDTEKYRKVLKEKGFLTRDSRIRERRKVGTGGKARRAKQSPKR